MKKLIVFILLFACVGVQQIQAQKWLKTLGKVASTLLDDDVSGTIPDCTLKYTDCKRNGNDVHINYVLTSQLGKDVPRCGLMPAATTPMLWTARVPSTPSSLSWVASVWALTATRTSLQRFL